MLTSIERFKKVQQNSGDKKEGIEKAIDMVEDTFFGGAQTSFKFVLGRTTLSIGVKFNSCDNCQNNSGVFLLPIITKNKVKNKPKTGLLQTMKSALSNNTVVLLDLLFNAVKYRKDPRAFLQSLGTPLALYTLNHAHDIKQAFQKIRGQARFNPTPESLRNTFFQAMALILATQGVVNLKSGKGVFKPTLKWILLFAAVFPDKFFHFFGGEKLINHFGLQEQYKEFGTFMKIVKNPSILKKIIEYARVYERPFGEVFLEVIQMPSQYEFLFN